MKKKEIQVIVFMNTLTRSSERIFNPICNTGVIQKQALEETLVTLDEEAQTQAALLVKKGGLGIIKVRDFPLYHTVRGGPHCSFIFQSNFERTDLKFALLMRTR